MSDRTEALLIAAARAEHVAQTIRPAFEAGEVVLCDRFTDSSLAYQGHARGLGVEDVRAINGWATAGVAPDATILLRLDPAVGMDRLAGRQGAARDRMEGEDLAFHRSVADGYLALAREDRDRYVLVEADGEPDHIATQIRSALNRWLPLPEASAPEASAPETTGPDGGPRSAHPSTQEGLDALADDLAVDGGSAGAARDVDPARDVDAADEAGDVTTPLFGDRPYDAEAS